MGQKMTKHYKDESGQIWGFDDDQLHLVPIDYVEVPMPQPPEPTEEDIQAMKNAEARRYLTETDWYVVRKMETGVEIPEEILVKRQEARQSIMKGL